MNKKQEYKDFIVELAKLFKPKLYVEIGVKNGYTFNDVSLHCEESFGVDIKLGKDIRKGENIFVFEETSQDFFKRFIRYANHKRIDLLFIDADHSYNAVREDFVKFAYYVKENGLILLHDTYPVNERLLKEDRCGDAWKFAKELSLNLYGRYEIVTLPGPWAGLSIIRKKFLNTFGWMDEQFKEYSGEEIS